MRDMARGFDECPSTMEKYSTFYDAMLHIFAQAGRRGRVSTSQSGGTRKKWPGRAYFSKMESNCTEGGFFGEGASLKEAFRKGRCRKIPVFPETTVPWKGQASGKDEASREGQAAGKGRPPKKPLFEKGGAVEEERWKRAAANEPNLPCALAPIAGTPPKQKKPDPIESGPASQPYAIASESSSVESGEFGFEALRPFAMTPGANASARSGHGAAAS